MALSASPIAPERSLSSPSLPTIFDAEDDDFHVRFVESCTLIPSTTLSNSPRGMVQMTTKELHLPRISSWTKHSPKPRRSASDGDQPVTGSEDKDKDKVMRIVLPQFRRSSHRNRSTSRSPVSLTPCLVHRNPSTSPDPTLRRRRRPSLPTPLTSNPPEETIPLRSCCQQCIASTEDALTDPRWVEKFTAGAQKLRNMYCTHQDNSIPDTMLPHPALSSTEQFVKQDLKVDEVDKKHPSPVISQGVTDDHAQIVLLPPLDNGSSSSLTSSGPPSPLSPLGGYSSKRISGSSLSGPCSSPIYEMDEDESQLFPLPSPRRTPSSSPTNTPPDPSPSSSSSNLAAPDYLSSKPVKEKGRRSPLSSEIRLDITAQCSDESPEVEVLGDILPATEGLTRKDHIGTHHLHSSIVVAEDELSLPTPQPRRLDDESHSDSVSQAIHSKGKNGSADDVPQAFLDAYLASHSPPAESPSQLPSFHRRTHSSSSSGDPTSPSPHSSPEASRSPRSGTKRKTSFLGDMLKGVSAGLSGV